LSSIEFGIGAVTGFVTFLDGLAYGAGMTCHALTALHLLCPGWCF
jgi:hypothetical protein